MSATRFVRAATGGAAYLALGWLAACSAGPNVVLRRSPSVDTGTLGVPDRCEVGESPCVKDNTVDTSLFANASTYFRLPTDCQFGIEAILVQNAGGSNARALVECASRPPFASDGGTIPTTAPGGGTSSIRSPVPTMATAGGASVDREAQTAGPLKQ